MNEFIDYVEMKRRKLVYCEFLNEIIDRTIYRINIWDLHISYY